MFRLGSKKLASGGFTLIELMVAISTLSVILLIVAVGIIQISKTYYQGITQANTQQTARAIMDTLTQSVQFGNYSAVSAVTNPSKANSAGFVTEGYCIGQDRFNYIPKIKKIGALPNDTTNSGGNYPHAKHVLWQDNSTGPCASIDVSSANPSVGHELLGENMRLVQLSVTQGSAKCTGDSWCIDLTIMYGDDDLIDTTNPSPALWQCLPSRGVFSAAFCAKASFSTVVNKRL